MEVLRRIWIEYPWAVDFLLFFFVFSAAARVAFAKLYPTHEGRALSLSVGLVLSAGLVSAQRKTGFSLESLGPIAALLLALVVFIVANRLLKNSAIPTWMTVLFAGVFGLTLLRAVLPSTSSRIATANPGLMLLLLGGSIYWAWHAAAGQAESIERKLPSHGLTRFQLIPKDKDLSNESKWTKRGPLKEVRGEQKESKRALSKLERAIHTLEREGITPKNKAELLRLTREAGQSANSLEKHATRLRQLDDALERFDLKWLKQAHGASMGQLTGEQRKIAHDTVLKERARLEIHGKLKSLEMDAAHTIRALEQSIAQSLNALSGGDPAGASGWLTKALTQDKQLRDLQERCLKWEKRLLKLVKEQRRELASK